MSLWYSCVRPQKFATENYTTTDSWATARTLDVGPYHCKTIIIKNTHGSNSIDMRIYATVDDGTNYDIPVHTAVTLDPSDVIEVNIEVPYTHLKIEAKSASAGNAGTCTTRGYATGV